MPRIRLLFGVSFALCVPALTAAQACAPGALSLEQTAVQALPATFGIDGLTTAPGGRVALWSAAGEILEPGRDHALFRQQLPDSIHPIGLGITSAGYRILDERTGTDLLLDADGRITPIGPVRLQRGDIVDRAVWRDGQWLLLIRQAATHEFQLRFAGSALPLYRSAPADSLRTIPRYHLSEATGGLLLTRFTSPFDVIRIDPATSRVDTLAPLTAQLTGIPADSVRQWRALPAVAIECGLLMTLSDLTSDRRLLVRYGAAGTVDRVTALEAPLGLMARLPGERTVLAARRTGDLELVWYDWRWAREPAASP